MIGETTRFIVSSCSLQDTHEIDGERVQRHHVQLNEVDLDGNRLAGAQSLSMTIQRPEGTHGPATGSLLDLTIAEVV